MFEIERFKKIKEIRKEVEEIVEKHKENKKKQLNEIGKIRLIKRRWVKLEYYFYTYWYIILILTEKSLEDEQYFEDDTDVIKWSCLAVMNVLLDMNTQYWKGKRNWSLYKDFKKIERLSKNMLNIIFE